MRKGSLQSALPLSLLVFGLQLVIFSLVASIDMVKLKNAASCFGKYILEQFN